MEVETKPNMSKTFVCQTNERAEEDSASDKEVEEFTWVPGEL